MKGKKKPRNTLAACVLWGPGWKRGGVRGKKWNLRGEDSRDNDDEGGKKNTPRVRGFKKKGLICISHTRKKGSKFQVKG